MTIEQKVRDIVDAHLSDFTFVFEDWETADIVIDKVQLPAIIFILPISGSLSFGRYGRIKDAENCAIAFVDKVTRRANGDDNEAVYTQMKQAAKTFLQQVNESGYFEPVQGNVTYNVIYEQLSSIVTGVMLSVQLKELVGVCE